MADLAESLDSMTLISSADGSVRSYSDPSSDEDVSDGPKLPVSEYYHSGGAAGEYGTNWPTTRGAGDTLDDSNEDPDQPKQDGDDHDISTGELDNINSYRSADRPKTAKSRRTRRALENARTRDDVDDINDDEPAEIDRKKRINKKGISVGDMIGIHDEKVCFDIFIM